MPQNNPNLIERNLIRVPVAILLGVLIWAAWTATRSPIWRDAETAGASLRLTVSHLAAAAADLKTVTSELADPRSGVARTLRNVNTVTAQLGRTANVARLASSDQRAELKVLDAETLAVVRKLGGAVDAAGALIAGANRNVNQGALPALTADLEALKAAVESLTADSHLAIGATTATMQQAGALLADPSIPAATKSFALAGEHVAGASANIEEATGFVRDDLKPQKLPLWKSIMTAAVSAAFGIPLRWFPQRVRVVK